MPIFTSDMKRAQPAVEKKNHHSEIKIYESIENGTEDDDNQRDDNDVNKHITCISEIIEKHVRENTTLLLHSLKNHIFIEI